MEEKVWEGDERVMTKDTRCSEIRVEGRINQREGRHVGLVSDQGLSMIAQRRMPER